MGVVCILGVFWYTADMKQSKNKKFILIDGNALLHRAWHALPPLTTKKGEMISAVYGFTTVLLTILREFQPEYLAVAFDVAAPTFRHKQYEDYKAHREKQPQELYDQIPRLKELLRAFHITVFEKEGYEADDIIGTLAREASGTDTIVVTGDMDLLQLIDDHTSVYTMKRGISEAVIYDSKAVRERYGLAVDQLRDYKALRGDPSDNIPGVRGIGEKTATRLLADFGTLDELYDHLEKEATPSKNIKPAMREKLLAGKKDAYISRELATIVRDIPLSFSLEECAVQPFDRAKIVKLFQQLEFATLLKKLPESEEGETFTKDDFQEEMQFPQGYTLIDDYRAYKNVIRQLTEEKAFAFDTETTSLNTLDARIVGISFSWYKGKAVYCALPTKQQERQRWMQLLQPVMQRTDCLKIGHNMKYDLAVLANECVVAIGPFFDTMVASYVLHTQSRGHDLNTLALTECGHEMISIEKLLGPKGKKQLTMDQVSVHTVAVYACEDADYTWRLYERFTKQLETQHMRELFEKIEMPLVSVLEAMEREGIAVDADFLQRMKVQLEKEIVKIKKKIFALSGSEFNIASPLQLKKVLFEDLGIPTAGLKKTKTGISTAAKELEKMRNLHPIISLISDFRELTKLVSTYIDALPKLIHKKTGRVHTSFNQAVTTTGRLSSSDPNLQNIPIRTSIGREIRKAFIAKKGWRLMAADYSQIELRIVASLANDKKMLQSFKKGEDIHTRTAAEIAECELTEVTPEMRRAAKTINFGVLYGMGAYGLAASAGITQKEAKEFIEKYFSLYKGVASYLEKTKTFVHKHKYVKTLFGRIRHFPDIDSGLPQVRAQAERMAVNMPIQGTAADIMKLAMIEVYGKLDRRYARLLLQVHDEVVVEVQKGKEEKVGSLLKETMEHIHTLKTPLKVKVIAGKNWGEMHELITHDP